MRYLHAMVRIGNIEQSLAFHCGLLGLEEVRRIDNPIGRFTLIFLAAPGDSSCLPASGGTAALPASGRTAALPASGRTAARDLKAPLLELTYNYDPETYGGGRNFGHLAFEVDDIYAVCDRLMNGGVVIARPPRDGRMAFVRSPDNISIELLQKGVSLAKAEPWASMANTGEW